MLVTQPQAISYRQLYALGCQCRARIKCLYLHWSAGHYGQAYDDYHLNIDRDGTIYQTCSSLTEVKQHTYLRNSGSIGISLCCGYQASCHEDGKVNLGPEPPTHEQIEALARVIAILTYALGLPLSYATVKTHAEIACMDGYGPGCGDPDMRWDLWYLPDVNEGYHLRLGGVLLRERGLRYRDHFFTPRPSCQEGRPMKTMC